MSCARLSNNHLMIIGYVLAKIENRQYYLYEIHSCGTIAAELNNDSINARYNEKNHVESIEISKFQNVKFSDVSVAQQAKAIDCFLYNSDNAPGFDDNVIVKKLRAYREELEFNENDYDSCDWFIESLPTKQQSHAKFVAEYERINCVEYRR